ncbi:MAG: response regulator [Halobacteriovoraceae bacterium]|nr:response regulator [Halobacteriovoraceae bacterium]
MNIEAKRCNNIFFVDDESSLHTLIKFKFKNEIKEGYVKTFHFHSAEDCLKYLDANPIDVDILFSDVNMPQMNGIELAQIIRSKFPSTTIFLATAYSLDPTKIEYKNIGIKSFFSKPLDFTHIKHTISQNFLD